MPHHLDPVHPHGGVVVDGAEVQDGSTGPPPRGHFDRAAVPDRLEEVGVPDPRSLTLGGERDKDLVGELTGAQTAFESAVGGVDLELPAAVEVDSVGSEELRTRVLRLGNHA
ncbi:hypothetical protein GCM10022204_43350 [Microlunatus aurantiacus]|uniref:Uncharacterized protein n=1 Tax=Microlunatus aurantiacus TaxID=446786 RepID=A0ABP7EHY7_9ACTN